MAYDLGSLEYIRNAESEAVLVANWLPCTEGERDQNEGGSLLLPCLDFRKPLSTHAEPSNPEGNSQLNPHPT